MYMRYLKYNNTVYIYTGAAAISWINIITAYSFGITLLEKYLCVVQMEQRQRDVWYDAKYR